jgi:GntR family transcriptional regulator/MocR family aminotransferase
MDTLFEIKLDAAAKGSRQASESLYRQLKAAILDGRLAAGAKLPVPRMSSRFLGVSRNTAAAVYERLASEGHVVTRRGSGSYVADAARARRARGSRRAAPKPVARGADHRLNPFWLRPDVTAAMDFWRDEDSSTRARAAVAPVDFRPALIDSRLFPEAREPACPLQKRAGQPGPLPAACCHHAPHRAHARGGLRTR